MRKIIEWILTFIAAVAFYILMKATDLLRDKKDRGDWGQPSW